MPITDTKGRWRSALVSVAIMVVSVVLTAELFSFLFLRFYIHSPYRPRYLAASIEHSKGWRTQNPLWGGWHAPDMSNRQNSACFSIAQRSNSYGARDRERARISDGSRVVVLGDSFAEGWGVEENERVSNLLEAKLKREFLNFGSGGGMGPLQYQIIYDQLAAAFSHDQVMILFLPDNDFTDNDPGHRKPYRPYYEKTVDGYRPAYPVLRADKHRDQMGAARIFNFINMNSWSAETIHYATDLALGRYDHAGYFDYTPAQLDAVLWSFRQIKLRAGERQVVVVVIPRPNDIVRTAREGESPMLAKLRQFGAENGITILDLLPAMRAGDPGRLFLSCDGHWSVEGNRVAADAILASGLFGRAR